MRDAMAGQPLAQGHLVALGLALGALAAPHASTLALPVLGLFYLALCWRLVGVRHPRLLPGRWVLVLLLPLALGLVILSAGVRDGRLAGTALLVVMLGLKFLELRSRRDFQVALFLGYFLVLTQFLFNQSLWLAAYLFGGVLALLAIQVGVNRVAPSPRRQLRFALWIAVVSLPLAAVVFLVFPRLQSPLWAIEAPRATTGISGELRMGTIGELTRSNATAFRVRFLGEVPPPGQRYWRGPVLWETDGQRWSAKMRPVQQGGGDRRGQHAVAYEVTLEPTGEYWMFGLDVVVATPPAAQLDRNFALVGETRVNQRTTYRAVSDPDLRMTEISAFERRWGLQLPDGISTRTRDLVAQWQRETDPQQPLQLINRALQYFREQPFVYTLSPPRLDGDPVDQFLFETRRGFCEHYAASFTVLMRLAGLPTRIVAGYQGGEPNPHADHWVVRQSDAHAWTEVWLPELGWWRVDPTAAVAPERIEQPIDRGSSEEAASVVFGHGGGALTAAWRHLVWVADAVDLGWYRWVIGFSAERQSSLLEQLGLAGLRSYGLALLLTAAGVVTIGFVYLASRLPRRRRDEPLVRLWQRYVDKLARAGVPVAPWHGPDTLFGLASRHYPHSGEQLAAINRIYIQLRYGRQQSRRQFDALRRRIRRLRLR